MMIEIENVKPGQTFKSMGFEYRLLRHVGEGETFNVNQWGRATGGKRKAHVAVVKSLGYKGRVSRVAYYVGQMVTVS